MITTTPGQLMINESLPADMRAGAYDLDKKGMEKLFTELAQKHPDEYRDVLHKLTLFGHYAAEASGTSISLSALKKPKAVKELIDSLNAQVKTIAENDSLPAAKKEKMITDLVGANTSKIKDMIFQTGLAENNPFAQQAASGSRGNANQLMQLVAGDGLVADHRDRVIGVPILHGYSEGLDPAEYFAGSYGARKGSVSTKFAVAESGFFGKQLAQAAHRLVVTMDDCGTQSGIPVLASDKDNEGSLLARNVGDYKAGTPLTSKIMKALDGQNIYVRSPVSCQAPEGICAKCAGIREKGRLPHIGDNIGMPAAQALSEKMSQGMLSAKHGGGQVGAGGPSKAGFKYVDQLIQVPTNFAGSATLADKDGKIESITDAPQGGKFVTINKAQFYIPGDQEPILKVGADVEAGDALSNGTPNPAEVAKYKGIGEARNYFIKAFQDGFKNSGLTAHRRNIEVMARALINNVRITSNDGFNGFLPDDVVSFDEIRNNWKPRENSSEMRPDVAYNKYLEHPTLHYSIGTRITKRIQQDLKSNKIDKIMVHDDPPPFEPQMIRALEVSSKDPNPMTRLYGSYLGKGLGEAVNRGRTSKTHDTSFVPSLAEGVNFGKNLTTEGKY